MSNLLRQYIIDVIKEVTGPTPATQLLSPKKGKKTGKKPEDEKSSDEVDEVSVVANIAGYTAPLGAGSDDMGSRPVKPGGKVKKSKRNFVRWK